MGLRHLTRDYLSGQAGGDPWLVNQSLQSGRPAQITYLGQAFHSAGQSTVEADTAFNQALQRFEVAWNRENGQHPINDSAEVARVTNSLHATRDQLAQIGVDLENIAAALAEAQRSASWYISALDDDLQDIDDEIDDALADHEDPDELYEEAVEETVAVLDQVDYIRESYSATLQAALAHLQIDGYDRPQLLGLFDAPPTTNPDEVKTWWNSLSQEERDRLIAEHPQELGNLNGIPAEVRDTVNQAVMNDDLNRVLDTAKRYGVSVDDVVNNPAMYGLSAVDITRYTNADKTNKGLQYDSQQGTRDGYQRPVFLWAYDPLAFNGQGRAAISIGNPDKARNTTVIVPGTGSSVAQGWMSDHIDAINMYDQALRADPQAPTAVMAWMGYDAPDGFSDRRVMEPLLAREGGALLAADVNGLAVTHDGSIPSHVTVIGHSYGSTTVADAFAGSGMHANDAVLIGCPGTDLARSAGDFNLTGGHVYVGSASTDPITLIGELDGAPSDAVKPVLPPLLRDLGIIDIPPDAGVGRDPAAQDFGAIRFHAEVPGSDGLNPHDHSHYYQMGSEALRSMTDIATGHGDALAAEGLGAEPRHPPVVGTPREIHIPGLPTIHLPHVEAPLPLPAFVDPEWDRPPERIHDDHAY